AGPSRRRQAGVCLRAGDESRRLHRGADEGSERQAMDRRQHEGRLAVRVCIRREREIVRRNSGNETNKSSGQQSGARIMKGRIRLEAVAWVAIGVALGYVAASGGLPTAWPVSAGAIADRSDTTAVVNERAGSLGSVDRDSADKDSADNPACC